MPARVACSPDERHHHNHQQTSVHATHCINLPLPNPSKVGSLCSNNAAPGSLASRFVLNSTLLLQVAFFFASTSGCGQHHNVAEQPPVHEEGRLWLGIRKPKFCGASFGSGTRTLCHRITHATSARGRHKVVGDLLDNRNECVGKQADAFVLCCAHHVAFGGHPARCPSHTLHRPQPVSL